MRLLGLNLMIFIFKQLLLVKHMLVGGLYPTHYKNLFLFVTFRTVVVNAVFYFK
nr:MAG TPA: hypothetical protein [Caudoviricetes sp.]